jgi:hypothetical protein
VLPNVVRGFVRDLADARPFVQSGMIDPRTLRQLVGAIPASSHAQYPNLSRAAGAGPRALPKLVE